MTSSPENNLYRKLFSEMVGGFALHSVIRDESGAPADYRIIDANAPFLQLTGLSAADVIGNTLLQTAQQSGTKLLHLFNEVTMTGNPLVMDFHSPDLERHFKISVYRPETDHIACLLLDNTEAKKNEQALRESEATLKAHIDNSFDVIFTLDAHGNFVYVSPAWERHFGFPPSEIMGKSFAPTVHPDDFEPCVRYLTKVLSSGQGGTSPVYRVKCADGSLRSFVANGMPYIDTKGELLFIGVGHDVSAQLEAEQKRLDLERQLLHTQKLESLGVLAGGIAHDFNNLLQTILGNVELATLRVTPESSEHTLLVQAARAGNRAADLTSRLLAYSGRGSFIISRLNLNHLVSENSLLLRTAVPKNISIRMQLSRESIEVMGDSAQLQQVVMNLITNAAEAIELHSGTISLTTGKATYSATDLSSSRLAEKPAAGAFVYLEVTDDGTGMSEEVQQKIFDPFFTTKFTGRGLGMSAVLGIIKAHHGALFLTSSPGKGTVIRVAFPEAVVVPAAALSAELRSSTAAPSVPLPKERASSGTVLIVDDERSVLRICRDMVRQCGFTAITASDGVEALKLFTARSQEIDIILMDLTMPNMDGITAMSRLRSVRTDVRIILSSGFNEQEIDERLCDQPPTGFIRKPYRLQNLETELLRVMQLQIP